MSAKEIAVTGSPNTITDISIDIREEYLNTPILGALVSLNVPIKSRDETKDVLVLGQVSKLSTENRWHENASLKNYIKMRGALPNLTQVGDITAGKIQVIGAYHVESNPGSSQENYRKTRLSVPVGSGYSVSIANGSAIRKIMSGEPNVGYLGRFYGTDDVPAPVHAKHFGDFGVGGTGEAYMGGVFGPSGAGKSVIGATMTMLYARNDAMGVLILDPQSEFAENKFSQGQEFKFDFHRMLVAATNGKFDPNQDIIAIDHVRLVGANLFATLLARRGLLDLIGVGNKVDDATSELIDSLAELKNQLGKDWDLGETLDSLEQEEIKESDDTSIPDDRKKRIYSRIKETVINAAADAYAHSSRGNKRTGFSTEWDRRKSKIISTWNGVAALFSDKLPNGQQKQTVINIIQNVMLHGRKVILDLNPQHLNLDDDFKLYIMQFMLRQIEAGASAAYKKSTGANCLIVMDEAGRFIPQDPEEGLKTKIANDITTKVRELRKYRVGFQFIAQNITLIKKDIYRNLHYRIYGVGLAVGADADHIRSREGDEAFEMYNALPDPRLSKTFSYMVSGAIIALGSTGRPMYIEGFSSDAEIMSQNGIPFGSSSSNYSSPARHSSQPTSQDKLSDDNIEF